MAAFAPASRSECATLLPSPTYVSTVPVSAPRRSEIVSRSASAWHGCSKSESEFTTGTVAAPASTSRRSCSKVRNTIAST
jgi:hypothetical protein